MKPPRMVLVEWEDASTDDDVWVKRHDTPRIKTCIHQQVGWLLSATADHLILTCTVSENLLAGRTRIPAGMVRKITYLQASKGSA